MESNRLFIRDKLGTVGRWWFSIDSNLFLNLLTLISIGLIAVISTGPVAADKIGLARFSYIYKQLFFIVLALSILVICSSLSTAYIKFFASAGLIVSIILLIIIIPLGNTSKGARRWLYLFGFSLQPSEFTKTFFVIVNAWLLSFKDRYGGWHQAKYHNWDLYFISGSILFISIILLLEQPDYGMILLLIALYFAQIFMLGISIWIVTAGAALMVSIVTTAYFTVPYVHNRIVSFIRTLENPQLASYQVRKSLESLRNGLWFGTGPGEGTIKYNLPDCHTDFIFPVLAEELGILFCIVVLCLYAYIILHVAYKLFKETDLFICLSVFGLITQFALQVVINIGVTINLLPTKGLTLPFLSYGGSSLLNMALCFGFILGLTKKSYGNAENLTDPDSSQIAVFLPESIDVVEFHPHQDIEQERILEANKSRELV